MSSHGDLVSTPSEAQLKMEELAIEREKLDLKRDHESNEKFFVSIEVGGSMCAALISLAGVLYLAGVFDGYVACASMKTLAGVSTLGEMYDSSECLTVEPGATCEVFCNTGFEPANPSRTTSTYTCKAENDDPDAQPATRRSALLRQGRRLRPGSMRERRRLHGRGRGRFQLRVCCGIRG